MPAPLGDGTYVNTIQKPNGRVVRYLRVSAGPQRGKYVHQLVAEAKLGRALLLDEEVDHENGDTLDNDWRNVIVRNGVEHAHEGNRRRRERRQAGGRRNEVDRGRDDLDGRRQGERREADRGDQPV